MLKKYKDIIQTKGGILSPILAFYRTKYALKFLKNNKKVLDYGCDLGNFSKFVNKKNYTGFDINDKSIKRAKEIFKAYNFINDKSKIKIKHYDVIISLAVIEHIKDPKNFILELQQYLKDEQSIIILTTPNPLFRILHEVGSNFKLFSNEASEDHEELIGYKKMEKLIIDSSLKIIHHNFFLFGANQLFVLKNKN